MANVILTSTSTELRKVFNGDDFFQANYDHIYNEVTKQFNYKLRLNYIPSSGDYLYFYDNYYRQIPVHVSRISRNNSGDIMIVCELTELGYIDPYLYRGDYISDEVRNDIIDCYKFNKTRIINRYAREIEEYPNMEKLRFIANYIDNNLGLSDNTVIDHMNVIYLIEQVISEKFGFEWHRPNRWEYSDM